MQPRTPVPACAGGGRQRPAHLIQAIQQDGGVPGLQQEAEIIAKRIFALHCRQLAAKIGLEALHVGVSVILRRRQCRKRLDQWAQLDVDGGDCRSRSSQSTSRRAPEEAWFPRRSATEPPSPTPGGAGRCSCRCPDRRPTRNGAAPSAACSASACQRTRVPPARAEAGVSLQERPAKRNATSGCSAFHRPPNRSNPWPNLVPFARFSHPRAIRSTPSRSGDRIALPEVLRSSRRVRTTIRRPLCPLVRDRKVDRQGE